MSDLLIDVVGAYGGNFDGLQRRCCQRLFPHISRQFRAAVGNLPNVLFPKTLGEMVQWRKVFERNPLFHVLSDKLAVKTWATQRVDGLKVAEVVWAASDVDKLPSEYVRGKIFVIKTNHGCGYNYFPCDYAVNDVFSVKKKFKHWLQTDYASFYSEWGYSKIDRKVFVERMLSPRAETEDLKFWCHNGNVSLSYIAVNEKQDTEKCGYFDVDGAPILDGAYTLSRQRQPPSCFLAAMDIAKKLSVGLDYIRVDFIVSAGEPYLVEITLYPAAGYGSPSSVSRFVLAGWLKEIEQSLFMRTTQPLMREAYKNRLRRHFDEIKHGIA